MTKNEMLKKALEYWAHRPASSSEGLDETVMGIAALAHASYLVCRGAIDKATEDSEHEDDATCIQALVGFNQISQLIRAYLEHEGCEMHAEINKCADALCATIDLLPKKN